ncbi:type II toxin-antitoxin system VapC family toxin [Campylobacter sp. RM12327]|nr:MULTISPECIES: type II toxin-antitoxin system VapC family toxin [Campylobacter]ASM40114.1 PIN domain protein [Campylobacter sputorum]MBF6670061.1 type II toxin-antitoxin system VapC family toxin [Campylobacter sp. RM12327]
MTVSSTSIPTIYYIASNAYKENQFFIQQMISLRNQASVFNDKLNKNNAFEVAKFFIDEILKEPKQDNNKKLVIEALYSMCNNGVVELLPTTSIATIEAIKYCRDNPSNDLEDVLQYFIAKENGCDVIYTNDKKFPKLDIPLKRTDPNIPDYIPTQDKADKSISDLKKEFNEIFSNTPVDTNKAEIKRDKQ